MTRSNVPLSIHKHCAALLLLLAAGQAAAAAFPAYINYQGKLGNPAGNPLTGTYSFRFRLYTQATGGALLATDENYTGANAVSVVNGLYSVQIGSLTAGGLPEAAFAGAETWLEIDVSPGTDFTGSETLAPRERLAAAPFAFRAAFAEKVGTGVASGTFSTDGNLGVPYGVSAATMTTTGAITVGAAGYQFSGRPVATAVTSPLDNILRLTSGVSQRELSVTGSAVVIGETASGAPPASHTLRATSGDGVNNTGSSLIIAAGAGSGTGLGGAIIFQSSTGTVAGSVTQAYQEHARITPFGSLGLGTASPASKLHMSSGTLLIDGNIANSIDLPSYDQSITGKSNGSTNPSLILANSGDGGVILHNGAGINLRTGSPTYKGLYIYGDTNGPTYVGFTGIGTTAPEANLDVFGNAQFGTTRKSTMTATGEIVSPSSITASAFFGDGSNLTGISGGVAASTVAYVDAATASQITATDCRVCIAGSTMTLTTGGSSRVMLNASGVYAAGATYWHGAWIVDGARLPGFPGGGISSCGGWDNGSSMGTITCPMITEPLSAGAHDFCFAMCTPNTGTGPYRTMQVSAFEIR